ncbi:MULTISPECIES: GNAT family N-acetyltransferase [unclassified Streptomyces]|uniref:GNAT family N-acetyltransferase n=1 Tax=unclassified Streptomyces TaxID=2593676 RepID=UPI00336AC621
MNPRRATGDDAPELARLRGVMFASLGPVPDGPWFQESAAAFADRLEYDPAFAAFVIDDGAGRLLSCAIGVYTPLLPSPRARAANIGHILSVATDLEHRSRGHARACVAAVMGWLAERDCGHIQLRASSEGQSLYVGLGFEIVNDVFMIWRP